MRGFVNLSLNYVSSQEERGLIKHYSANIIHIFVINKKKQEYMEYQKLEYYLSQPRLNRFLIATGNSKTKAQKLYRINLRVAQSFYPVLNLFEIFFRNTVNYQVSSYFANPNWIITEKNGFMSDPSLSPSRFFLKNSITKAERAIRRRGGTVTPGKVVAEQTLGY
jgi:hypothetical protein